jgi:hypothetical protein
MMVDMGFGESTFVEGGCMKWREALTAFAGEDFIVAGPAFDLVVPVAACLT